MTDPIHTSTIDDQAPDNWKATAPIVLETYLRQNDIGTPTHVVEIQTHQHHNESEYEVFIRACNNGNVTHTLEDRLSKETTLYLTKTDTESRAHTIAMTAMNYIDSHEGTFDEDNFTQTLKQANE